MGRRTKLTQELIREAANLLAAGNYANTVCAALGVSETAWYNWLNEAEAPDANPLKVEFLESVSTALAEAEIRYVGVIDEAAKDDPKWASWWLERRCGDRWTRQDRHRHEHIEAGGVLRVPGMLAVDEWAEAARIDQAKWTAPTQDGNGEGLPTGNVAV